jgi:hypothetical protein
MSKLLRRYIKDVVAEVKLARVPNQLIAPDEKEESGNEDEAVENVNEFSGVGAIAGYSGPLGINPDKLGRKKNSRKK